MQNKNITPLASVLCLIALITIFSCVRSISALQWLCNADKKGHKPPQRLHRFFTTLYSVMVRKSRDGTSISLTHNLWTHVTNLVHKHFLWNCSQVNATEHLMRSRHCFRYGEVLPGNKPCWPRSVSPYGITRPQCVKGSLLISTAFNSFKVVRLWDMSNPRMLLVFNSLWLSDAILQQGSGSTSAQVMTAPSHYLNQCWLIINKVQWHSKEDNFKSDTSAINDQN